MKQNKKYNLLFDFDDNQELFNNKQKLEEFKDKLKEKISLVYNIKRYKIVIIPSKISSIIHVIFQSNKCYNLNLNDCIFIYKFIPFYNI